MSDYDFLPASNGSGDAALMHVNGGGRLTGATVIPVDTVVNVPAKFIGTYGTLDADGFITAASKREFKGHISGSTIIIDAFEPGFADAGNAVGDVVVVRPATGWANRVAAFLKNMTNVGTPENVTVAGLTATGTAAITGNITSAGTIRPLTGVFKDGNTDVTWRYKPTAGDITAGYIFVTIPHGLGYTPSGVRGTIRNLGDGLERPLPWTFTSNLNYSTGIPVSATMNIFSVDATNVVFRMNVHDATGISMWSTAAGTTGWFFRLLLMPGGSM